MKITKSQLRRIIREEKKRLIKESSMELSYQYAEQLLQDATRELADNFSDGQLGNGAHDAKMDGKNALYELLTLAAMRTRGLIEHKKKANLLNEYIDRDYLLDRLMEVLIEEGAVKPGPGMRDDALQYLGFLVKVYDRGR